MLRPRFFSSQPLPEGGGLISLDPEASRHIARTLRMRAGDLLCLFDGSGHEAAGRIASTGKSTVSVQVEPATFIDRESPLTITLAIAVSRGDRMDTVVQKATELGVQRIWPLLSERVGVKLADERWQKKLGHWQRVAISACEQCGRNRLPEIAAPASLETAIARAGDSELRLLLHPDAGGADLPASCRSLCLLVGPEGGFSDREVQLAIDAGFTGMQLGPRVLRTETAPLAALAVVQARWGDLGACASAG